MAEITKENMPAAFAGTGLHAELFPVLAHSIHTAVLGARSSAASHRRCIQTKAEGGGKDLA